jgi:soluble lytic murein transglycosylase-like protein
MPLKAQNSKVLKIGSLTFGLALVLTNNGISNAPCAQAESQSHEKALAGAKPQITQEIANLWQRPSREFLEATKDLGVETDEVSIGKLNSLSKQLFGVSALENLLSHYMMACLLQKRSIPEKQEAAQLFQIAVKHPGNLGFLKNLAMLHQVAIYEELGNEKELRELLEKINKSSNFSQEQRLKTLYQMGQSYMRSREEGPARAIFLDLKNSYANSNYGQAANYYLAQIALREAETGITSDLDAPALLRAYLATSTGGRFSREAGTQLIKLVGEANLTASDIEALAQVYYKAQDSTRALQYLDRLGPAANGRGFQRAICLARLGRNKESQEEFLLTLSKNKSNVGWDDCATIIGAPLNKADTLALWRKALAMGPNKPDPALWNIATRTTETEALGLYAKIAVNYPTSEFAPEANWWLFWINYKKLLAQPGGPGKHPQKARELIAHAEQVAKKYPHHRSASRFYFWQGKIHEALGEDNLAHLAYQKAYVASPSNYYAGRAKQRLTHLKAPKENRFDHAWAIRADRPQSLSQWNWPRAGELFSMDHIAQTYGPEVAVLTIAKQTEECLSHHLESTEEAPKTAHTKAMLAGFKAWLQLSQNKPLEAIRCAGKDLEGYPSAQDPLWRITYPWAYANQIKEAAGNYKVDPFLVHALIREESRYNPKALSRSNAIGLMQLLPGTGYGVAKRLNIPLKSKEDIFLPDINIKLGTNYLSYTLGRFAHIPKAQAMLAVASYNGGPNAVKRWSEEFQASGQSDYDVFVENIPFRETRDYVRKVFGSYYTYESLYPG